MNLQGTVALLTGAKRVGAVVAQALASQGAAVGLSYLRSETEAQATARAIEMSGGRSAIFQADLAKPASCAALVDTVAATFGRLDVLVHMASVYQQRAWSAVTVDDWDAAVNLDLRAAFLCAQAAVPHMRRQGAGRIIVFSDWVAASGRPRYQGYVPYYVAKAGVKALSEALALELAADNILVNTIAPGPILAPPGTTEAEHEAVQRSTPLGRWGGEGEIAKVVLDLVESDFITGETIRVDGGRHLR
jgi:NAD(P)-dependent dehydrogenase (short-subunit alcohol dehydrogenase family)